MDHRRLLVAFLVISVHNSLLHVVSAVSNVHFYVSPNGSDQADGKHLQGPFKTINKAVSLVTNAEYAGANVFIELLEGHHDLEQTVAIKPHHANSVVIRSYNHQKAYVSGGKRIPSTSFKPVTDHSILSRLTKDARNHVKVVHLPDLNITDFGSLNGYGFHRARLSPLEVFYNTKPLTLAKWPNEGFINVVGVPDGSTGVRFRYNSSVPSTWHNESDAWVYGYWMWSWADKAIKIKQLDAQNRIVTLTEPTRFGLRTGHWGDADAEYTKQGGYFRFLNILGELDQPGEYYMDNGTGNLYVWMPNSDGNVHTSDEVYVSVVGQCFELVSKTKKVTFQDFTIETCRNSGIHGTNVANIQVLNMEIRNTGGYCIRISGENCYVNRCVIHDGDGGISIGGGNRNTLEYSGNTVENNEIYRYAREAAVGFDGVTLTGVGNWVRYNNIYYGQYTAIMYHGNNNIMEYNNIHHVCMNASDCGALHTGRGWEERGNVIRHNIVHHNLRLVPGADVRGVMLDDQASGTSITNNVFYDNHVHANIGGGRDNIVDNNVMYNATKSSMQVDGRGVTHRNDKDLYNHLHRVPYASSLWVSRYPAMVDFDHQNVSLPEGNRISKTLVYQPGHTKVFKGLVGWLDTPSMFNVTKYGVSFGPADHYDVNHGDFRVRCHAEEWANKVNFVQVISPNEVGPRAAVGPSYAQKDVSVKLHSASQAGACPTNAPPSTITPVASYLPDGSGTQALFSGVSNEGCWFSITKCSDHPASVGTYRDTWGEQHQHAADNETMCFQRAVVEWRYCGSHPDEQVAAIYGPSGATRLAGDGCFMAWYGCPKQHGPADGHMTQGHIGRDTYAEQHLGAAHNESQCLGRALTEWRWCGSHINHTVTSVYRPTGAIRTAGSGCWIHVQICPSHPETKSMFYDAFGATNLNTDNLEFSCLSQAEYYWSYCGSDTRFPVTAHYRPSTHSQTFPR